MKFNLYFSGLKNKNKDFLILDNIKNSKKIDYFIFLDSRGIFLGNRNDSWGFNLYSYLVEKGYSCVYCNRIKDITIFFTLINFINFNCFKYKNLITNVGFVDFTPKKKCIILDMIEQYKENFKKKKYKINKLNKYRLSNGVLEELFNFDLFVLKKEIKNFLLHNFEKILLLGTTETNETIKVERKRPLEFYECIKQTNKFLKELSKENHQIIFKLPLKKFILEDKILTLDNVHYNLLGHKIYLDNMIKILDKVFF